LQAFHRRAAENAKKLLFLFFAETRPPRLKAKPMAGRGRKTKIGILPKRHCFSFAVLSTAKEKISYSAAFASLR